jgi:hypothetical protein
MQRYDGIHKGQVYEVWVGLDRIVASEIDAPILLANLV